MALNGIWLQLAQWLLRRCLKLAYYENPGSKVKQWPWSLLFTYLSVLIKTTLVTIFFFFWPKHSKVSIKSNVSAFSHIWPCGKNDQGQPKVIKWTILVVLEYLMLHTVQPSWNSDSSCSSRWHFLPSRWLLVFSPRQPIQSARRTGNTARHCNGTQSVTYLDREFYCLL